MRRSLKSTGRREYDLLLALLAKSREDAGMSQSELARRLGREQPYVWKYEHGDQRLDMVEVRDISLALGLEFVVLMLKWDTCIKDGC